MTSRLTPLLGELSQPLVDSSDLRRLAVLLDAIASVLAERSSVQSLSADELRIDFLLASIEKARGDSLRGAEAARELAHRARQASYDSSDDDEYEEEDDIQQLARANELRVELVEALAKLPVDANPSKAER